MSKKIILLAGPTASGKSKLAIHLAKKLNGEIINADSMQLYKEFSILSSRPNKKEIGQAKHHLYGLISVKKYFSAGDWLKEAKRKINLCIKKKKIPIVVGGTGLYFNTITKGISKIPNIDLKTRDKVRNLFRKLGFVKFYERLIKLDPKVKNKILASDSQRAQRAYEVKLKTKKSIFDWIENTKSIFGILLIPLVIVLKYKPVPPTTIGIFFFLIQRLIFLFASFNQSPAEKYVFTEIRP